MIFEETGLEKALRPYCHSICPDAGYSNDADQLTEFLDVRSFDVIKDTWYTNCVHWCEPRKARVRVSYTQTERNEVVFHIPSSPMLFIMIAAFGSSFVTSGRREPEYSNGNRYLLSRKLTINPGPCGYGRYILSVKPYETRPLLQCMVTPLRYDRIWRSYETDIFNDCCSFNAIQSELVQRHKTDT
jgi:hypothetical protein